MKKTSPGTAGMSIFTVERLAELAAENGYGEIGDRAGTDSGEAGEFWLLFPA